MIDTKMKWYKMSWLKWLVSTVLATLLSTLINDLINKVPILNTFKSIINWVFGLIRLKVSIYWILAFILIVLVSLWIRKIIINKMANNDSLQEDFIKGLKGANTLVHPEFKLKFKWDVSIINNALKIDNLQSFCIEHGEIPIRLIHNSRLNRWECVADNCKKHIIQSDIIRIKNAIESALIYTFEKDPKELLEKIQNPKPKI